MAYTSVASRAEQAQEKAAKGYMRKVAREYRDSATGEYDATGLAQDTSDALILENGEGAPVWDWAVEVIEVLESR